MTKREEEKKHLSLVLLPKGRFQAYNNVYLSFWSYQAV